MLGCQGLLSNEDIVEYFGRGFVVKKHALQLDAIECLDSQIDKIIDDATLFISSACDKNNTQDQIMFNHGSRVVFKNHDNKTSIVRINGVHGMQPSLLNVLRSDKMVLTFMKLLNCNKIEHIISQLHPKLPYDGVQYEKHRDIQFRKSFDPNWKDVLGNGSYCICIIPIDPMNADNGGLYIDENNYTIEYQETATGSEQLRWLDLEPGDMLFMHPHLWHGSLCNTSNSNRRTLLTGYCAYGANSRPYPGVDMNRVISRDPVSNVLTYEDAPWAVRQNDVCSKHTGFH